jgi:peptidase M48-like protein
MTVYSYYQTMTSFSRQDLMKMCRNALVGAIPLLPLGSSLINVFQEIHPQLLFNDDWDDETGEDFILTNSQEWMEKFVNLYVKRRVEIIAPTEAQKITAQENFKSVIPDKLRQRISKIEQIAADFGIKKIAIGFSVPLDLSSQESPEKTMGGQFSYLSAPLIVVTPPRIKMEIKEETDSSKPALATGPVVVQTRGSDPKAFFDTHEMVHIAKNHTLICTISHAAFSILATGIWMVGMRGGWLSLASAARTYTVVLGSAVLFQLFYNTLRRQQEMEADLGAIKYLGSNEGAMIAFEAFEKNGPAHADLEHPPYSERLAYIRAEKLD